MSESIGTIPRLSDADVQLLKDLSKAVNRTAYHGGLGLSESGKYLAVIDRILVAHGESPP